MPLELAYGPKADPVVWEVLKTNRVERTPVFDRQRRHLYDRVTIRVEAVYRPERREG